MAYTYQYETFRADSAEFDKQFTQYLNIRGSERWRVKDCTYCHSSKDGKRYASCLFEKAA